MIKRTATVLIEDYDSISLKQAIQRTNLHNE